ncbi:Ligand-gated ion channel [Yoonia tamlensis]|uniref:Ligand-gated ion channel n=1 Tax=Yoonia tamlensis TaxID=390270 RepID=A0A1I6HUW3_9RHOB|nr:transporter substrate-binding domain-containing protein [Yoonia tamlensis]SFR58231.1 Ligand-gated ion channel [Yoonia tamlensis]
MKQILSIACAFFLFAFAPPPANAQQHCPQNLGSTPDLPIIVGTKFAPPFIMGSREAPNGLAVAFWEMIAGCLGLGPSDYRYVEYGTNAELVLATAAGNVDIALSNLPINLAHERIVDFSFPYFDASLGVIVPDRSRGANFAILLGRIFHSNILVIVAGLLGFMVFVGLVYWWMERRSGNEFFTQGPLSGLYRAMIWAALLVFQGQGNPFELRSRFGQLFVLLLMFVGVTIISSFTAIITSSLTLQALEPEINTIADLESRTVAVISQSQAAEWANSAGINTQSMRAFSQVQRNFDEDQIDVFVHEEAVLRYLVNDKILTGVKLAPLTVAPSRYAIALPPDSPLRESINLSLLTILDGPAWAGVLQEYFGTR